MTVQVKYSTLDWRKSLLMKQQQKASRIHPQRYVLLVWPEVVQLLGLYVDRFNRRDWDGLRELIGAIRLNDYSTRLSQLLLRYQRNVFIHWTSLYCSLSLRVQAIRFSAF